MSEFCGVILVNVYNKIVDLIFNVIFKKIKLFFDYADTFLLLRGVERTFGVKNIDKESDIILD